MNSAGLLEFLRDNAPLVVGVVTSPPSLENIISAPVSNGHYDAVELRLDYFPEEEQCTDRWLACCGQLEEKGLPVILTIRIDKEGGKWKGDDTRRRRLFAKALGTVSAVDIELASPLLAELKETITSSSTSLIGSYHNFLRTPPLFDLRLMASDARKDGVDIVKVVTAIRSEDDVYTLSELLEKEKSVPLCVIGMGPMGVDTRFSFPSLGSVLTYGYVDQPTAPGQSSCEELAGRLSEFMPSYRSRKTRG